MSTLQIDGLGVPEGYRPLAEYLSEKGYETGGFAVNGFVSRDYNYDSGFDEYYSVRELTSLKDTLKRTGRKVNNVVDSALLRHYLLKPVHNLVLSTATDDDNKYRPDHSDVDTVDRALSFVGRADGPFFLWIHLMDAHTPYGY